MKENYPPDMKRPPRYKSPWPRIIVITLIVVAVALGLNHVFNWFPWPWSGTKTAEVTADNKTSVPETTSTTIPVVIDYTKIRDKTDDALKKTIEERKEDFGLKESVDMIVSDEESIRVGNETVPLKEILAQIDAQSQGAVETPTGASGRASTTASTGSGTTDTSGAGSGSGSASGSASGSGSASASSAAASGSRPELTEEDLTAAGEIETRGASTGPIPVQLPDNTATASIASESSHQGSAPPPVNSVMKPVEQPIYYGVRVVRPGDNLWDIHFAILREYLNHRGIDVSPRADETPLANGSSSGIARILKYAESMVHIFNMKTRSLDKQLDLLEPEEKVVIFNVTNLHRILGTMTQADLDHVRFIGQDLFIEKPLPNPGQ